MGCVGSTIRRIAQAVICLVQPFFDWMGWHWEASEETPKIDVSFEVALLDGVQKGFVAPSAVFKHFERRVSSSSQDRIYEELGRDQPLSYRDQILNATWRNAQTVIARYRELGRGEAKMDPYLVATHLEAELQEKIDQANVSTAS